MRRFDATKALAAANPSDGQAHVEIVCLISLSRGRAARPCSALIRSRSMVCEIVRE
jgi:hypothetical protein